MSYLHRNTRRELKTCLHSDGRTGGADTGQRQTRPWFYVTVDRTETCNVCSTVFGSLQPDRTKDKRHIQPPTWHTSLRTDACLPRLWPPFTFWCWSQVSWCIPLQQCAVHGAKNITTQASQINSGTRCIHWKHRQHASWNLPQLASAMITVINNDTEDGVWPTVFGRRVLWRTSTEKTGSKWWTVSSKQTTENSSIVDVVLCHVLRQVEAWRHAPQLHAGR